MKLGYEISLKQVQRLIMTPELRQAITILQLPWMELEQYIAKEMLENPLLEFEDKNEDVSKDLTDDIDWPSYFENAGDTGYAVSSGIEKSPKVQYESFVSYVGTFHDYLTLQLHLSSLDEKQMEIGNLIIGGIDDDGYLCMGIPEIASISGACCDKVEAVLKVIQQFDPAGVGGRTLEECLLIQLEALQETDIPADRRELAKILIEGYLDDIAQGGLVKISGVLGVEVLQVQSACDLIRTLDPKPGRQFSGGRRPSYIRPDATIDKIGDEYIVTVHDISAPRLGINALYRRMLKSGDARDAAAAEYIKSKLNSALWLIRSIDQRRQTLQKVIESIVKLQRDFFDKGVKFLKPMTLAEIAEEIEMHESTVSRATTGKYVATPKGTFELKYFFTSGVPTVQGKVASSESVKKVIREIIEKEDPEKPFSDRAIKDILFEQGTIISRRTVAKYRDEEGIAASPLRRRFS
ncbi:MAG: RNA polymerase factor sigma-54 [Firmicutes bacterium]|nr:RNA polymerase factor sigma-54 [Bacillota bacterium]